MVDVFVDTLLDCIKLLPFLLITFLILEYIEHKISNKNKDVIKNAGKYGPIIGALLGAFPQCGFSVAATNLYATRIITIGTLISIYLSTSDEMLPIMLSQKAPLNLIVMVIVLKVIVGMVIGTFIDLFLEKNKEKENNIEEFCQEEHCHCEKSIFISSVKHTLNIIIYIFVITLVINFLVYFIGEETIAKIFTKSIVVGPLIGGVVGLIPNCAASVIITELYLSKIINFGTMISGLLVSSGVALLVLFKVNKDKLDSIKVLLYTFVSGVLVGIIINLILFLINLF